MGLVKGMTENKFFDLVYVLICVIAIGIGITVWSEVASKNNTTSCTLPDATPDMICTKTPDGGCSCELSHEAFMMQMRRRACQYKMVGLKLLPSVEKDLKEHPGICEGDGYSGQWSSADCLNIMAKGKCPKGKSLICTQRGPECIKMP